MNSGEKKTKKIYALSTDQVLEELNTSITGLKSKESESRLKEYGHNVLPDQPQESFFKKFFKHFHNLLIYVLIVSALITALLGHWIDTAVIFSVVLINAIIGFIQEGKAEQALKSIKKMLSLHSYVFRDNAWKKIEANQLVPGDIVRLRSGDKVPADLRLLEVNNLQIEESALTGESVPVLKNTKPTNTDTSLGDRGCMAYSGTLVSSGRATAVVAATGASTEIGKINKMVSDVQKLSTPLTRQMNKLSKALSLVIVGMAGLLFLLGRLLHGFSFDDLFMASIGFAVAAIPEGLPAVLTITLALGVLRMARRNAIVRKLNAIETLGSVAVICSDKTGTLTKNEMTVCEVITASYFYEVSGNGYAPEGKIWEKEKKEITGQNSDLEILIEIMSVCNDSKVEKGKNIWKASGEPTEAALISLAKKAGFEPEKYKRIAEIPFESESKFMAVLAYLPNGKKRILVKGAPDKLLSLCQSQQTGLNQTEKIDENFWQEQIQSTSSKGLRLLAAAYKDVSVEKNDLSVDDLGQNMVFAGLTAIIDPPRPEAIEAVKICHQAGIEVKMITGDHAGTAKAIALKMDIGKKGGVITGSEIENSSDNKLRQLVRENDIFARTSPEHKLRLVKALQANGQTTAMTGDGVNDAPCLKRADVGIAMGIKGTEATKQAADIVLTDDNFTSIEQAIEEGRTIYDNLRKAILFILPTNGAEALVVMAAILAGLVLPLTPLQILWVNMVTAVTLALALSFEPPEEGLMKRPPRQPGSPILGKMFLKRIGFVSVLIGAVTIGVFLIEKGNGISLERARTLAVNTLVFCQVSYLFNSRFLTQSSLKLKLMFTNSAVWIAVSFLILFQLSFIYLPIMHSWFSSAPLNFNHWLISFTAAAVVFLIIEAEKKRNASRN